MTSSATPNLLGRAIGAVIMATMLVLGFMFSMVLFAVLLVLGVLAFGYFWWKSRDLRKAMREHAAMQGVAQAGDRGQVIEGEAVIVEEEAIARKTLQIIESRERQP